MKTVRLNGEYSYSSSAPCDFEDIPVFIKMATSTEGQCDEVSIMNIDIDTLVICSSVIQAWRIVKDQYGNLVLGFRTSSEPQKLPEVYRVSIHEMSKTPVLVSLNLSSFERLKLFYEACIAE